MLVLGEGKHDLVAEQLVLRPRVQRQHPRGAARLNAHQQQAVRAHQVHDQRAKAPAAVCARHEGVIELVLITVFKLGQPVRACGPPRRLGLARRA